MTPSLKSLYVKNFRSIRGEASLSLDAPVILLYGPNGSGKTSLMSALELALTGTVTSLERIEPDYAKYLPHKYAESGKSLIRLSTEGLAEQNEINVEVSGQANRSPGLLGRSDALFFSERCYLAQPTMNRLLEIYQFQESKKTDSPLTRFVKDLLRLDHLDALIDGLHPAGNVRRFKDLAPLYWDARETIPRLQSRLKLSEAELNRVRASERESEAKIHASLANLGHVILCHVQPPGQCYRRLAPIVWINGSSARSKPNTMIPTVIRTESVTKSRRVSTNPDLNYRYQGLALTHNSFFFELKVATGNRGPNKSSPQNLR